MSSTIYIWLITGASAGLGKALALKALSQDDKVVATSRNIGRLDQLRAKGAATVQLDHNESLDRVKSSVAKIVSVYGKIDIVNHTIKDYAKLNEEIEKLVGALHANPLGDPEKGAAIIYDVLTTSGIAKGRELPLEFALGSDTFSELVKSAQHLIDQVNDWKAISILSDPSESQ